MKIAMFDMHRFERESFEAASEAFSHEISFLEPRLTRITAALAQGHAAVCSFVNDTPSSSPRMLAISPMPFAPRCEPVNRPLSPGPTC